MFVSGTSDFSVACMVAPVGVPQINCFSTGCLFLDAALDLRVCAEQPESSTASWGVVGMFGSSNGVVRQIFCLLLF